MKNPNGYGTIKHLMRLWASWLPWHKMIKKPHKHGHILLEISTFISGIRTVGHIG